MTDYSLTEDSKGKSLAIFYDDGDTVTIPDTHANFDKLVDLFRQGDADDETVQSLANVLQDLGKRMSKISDRVSVTTYGVLFDGDPIRGELSDVILDLYKDNDESRFKALVNFLEKARTNPSNRSVDDLYKWITNGDLAITPEGDFVAYKGVTLDGEGKAVSVYTGKAIVDGIEHNGHIPNPDGAIVEMARSSVNDNSSIGCAVGLHAGTYSYATGWSQGALLLVKINPRDVVSVPDDSSFQKLRVSRYTVLSHIVDRLESRVYNPEEAPVTEEDEEELDEEPKQEYVKPKSHKPIRDAFGRFMKKNS